MAKNKNIIECEGYTPNIILPRVNLKNKKAAHDQYVLQQLNKTINMFEYKNLPDKIDVLHHERLVQVNGFSIGIDFEDNKYSLYAGLGGEYDFNYEPTIATVTNPALKLSKNYKINEECILFRNDSNMQGLAKMFSRYAQRRIENELTMYLMSVWARNPSIIAGSDDRTEASAKEFFKKLEEGELGVILENAFFEDLKTFAISNSAQNLLTQLIEVEQYLKTAQDNEVGINGNFNMKRESITAGESDLNSEVVIPLVADMLKCRREDWDRFNKMFGTNVVVELGPLWKVHEEEIEAEIEALENINETGETDQEPINEVEEVANDEESNGNMA